MLRGTKTPVDFWQGTVVPRDNYSIGIKKYCGCVAGNRNPCGFMVGDCRSPGHSFHRDEKTRWMCCRGTKVPVDFWTGVRNSYGSCLGNQTFLCSVSTAMQRSCGSGPANLGCCRDAPGKKRYTHHYFRGQDQAVARHGLALIPRSRIPGFNAAHRVAPGDADGSTAARTAHARGV